MFFYRQKLTSPKWNHFKGIRLMWKDKIRLNNLIWRCWHMQCKFLILITMIHVKFNEIVFFIYFFLILEGMEKINSKKVHFMILLIPLTNNFNKRVLR